MADSGLAVSGDGSDSGNMKRRGSWSRFKESVKETVQGWVSGPQQPENQDANVPSAVNPSQEVTNATINVKDVLHNTNCYSGTAVKRNDSATDVDIPRIVVTSEERQIPERPNRRGSSLRGRNDQSTTLQTETQIVGTPPATQQYQQMQQQEQEMEFRKQQQEFRQQQQEYRRQQQEMRRQQKLQQQQQQQYQQQSPPQNIPQSQGYQTPQSQSGPGSLEKESEDAINKKLATMKIKQAIFAMNSSTQDDTALLGHPPHNLNERRHSDVPNVRVMPPQSRGSPQPKPPEIKRNRSPSTTATMDEMQWGRRKSTSEALVRRSSSMKQSGVTRSSSVRKPKAKPMIWEHFEALPNTQQQGKCKACKMNVSCKFNTGNFVRHLQLAHKDIYRQYQNKIESQWTRSMLERNLK